MGVTITKFIREHTNGKRLNQWTGKWEQRRPLTDEERALIRRNGYTKVNDAARWVPCEKPQTLLYSAYEKMEDPPFRGGDVTTEIAVTDDLTITLNPEERELIIRGLLVKRQFSDPSVLGGGNPAAYRKAERLLSRLGVSDKFLDHDTDI